MTILAGAFSTKPGKALPDELRDALRRHISRQPFEAVAELGDAFCHVAKVDISAFGAPAMQADAAGNLTVLAGEALLREGDNDPAWNRARDTAALHSGFVQGRAAGELALAQSQGSFCGLHYSAARGELLLFVDRIGARPLYLWQGEDYAVFASALRILEALPQVRKEMDVRGVTEIAAFGYALGERTAYAGIRMLRSGEIARLADGAATFSAYARWDEAETPLPQEPAVQRSYDAFIAALRRRQRGASMAAAFLSGGLDSRAIVGGLHAIGAAVYTFNLAPDGKQDQVFAKLMAEHLGTRHVQLVQEGSDAGRGYHKPELKEWMRHEFGPLASDRPRLLWSGDGGSVSLGHVYMDRELVAAMQRGAPAVALARFNKGLPSRIIPAAMRETLQGLPLQGALEELESIQGEDRGRAFHLFLMFNDQRRHLAQHFEEIDRERMEFQLPFLDASFLETVLRQPVDAFLEHRFYMDWLARFPNGLDTVPWQAYPGHVPCELPMPAGLKYQWHDYFDSSVLRQMRRHAADKGRQVLASQRFPEHLISRRMLNAAVWLTRLGWRDCAYLINTASTFHKYWLACETARAPERLSR
ncbi:asparagine synthetase B family protein [Massilia sp. NR 4-1]|uniref:asparagine synthase-related protein n=1 Tax=Massilia sp. NR 4-1 TaxID=1678028 RepID=UPI00067B7C0A|nr:asparagine synthetase B family protein [Massilia sp. NR 4-1]